MDEDAIVARLDAIITRLDTNNALLKLSQRNALAAARSEILSDAVNREIFAGSARWVGAGKLQSAVARKTNASTRTVRDRIADLLATGLLEKRGGGPTTEYHSSGLL
jgi:hypothetical protein